MSASNASFQTSSPPSSSNCSCWSLYRATTSTIGCMLTVCSGNVIRFYDLKQGNPRNSSKATVDDKDTHKLVLRSMHRLSGNVVCIDSLSPPPQSASSTSTDVSLLLTFGGSQQTLSIVKLCSLTGTLKSTAVCSLYEVLRNASKGMNSALSIEPITKLNQETNNFAVVLGGGTALVIGSIERSSPPVSSSYDWGARNGEESEWGISATYTLDLRKLSRRWKTDDDIDIDNAGVKKVEQKRIGIKGKSVMSTGFGDITGIEWALGYNEPTIAILHQPRGRTWKGRASERLRPAWITAVSAGVEQKRATIVWQTRVLPNDTLYITCVPGKEVGRILAVASNTVSLVMPGGVVKHTLATNGYAKSGLVGPELWPRSWTKHPESERKGGAAATTWNPENCPHGEIRGNPRPLGLLRVEMGGSRVGWIDYEGTGILATKDGGVYALEVRDERIWMVPTGYEFGDVHDLCVRPVYIKGMEEEEEEERTSDKDDGWGGLKVKVEDVDKGRSVEGSSNVTGAGLDNLRGGGSATVLKPQQAPPSTVGMVWAGSRTGDSSLIAYAKKKVKVGGNEQAQGGSSQTKVKFEDNGEEEEKKNATPAMVEDDKEERMLRLEEEELYRGSEVVKSERCSQSSVNDQSVVTNTTEGGFEGPAQDSRGRVTEFSKLDFNVLDTILQCGPLGVSINGPCKPYDRGEGEEEQGYLGESPTTGEESEETTKMMREKIMAAGHGRDGGLVIFSNPGGSTESSIIGDEDAEGTKGCWSLDNSGVVVIGRRKQVGEEKESNMVMIMSEGEISECDRWGDWFKSGKSKVDTSKMKIWICREVNNHIYMACGDEEGGWGGIVTYEVKGGKAHGLGEIEIKGNVTQVVMEVIANDNLGIATLMDDGNVKLFKGVKGKVKEYGTLGDGKATALDVFVQNWNLWERKSNGEDENRSKSDDVEDLLEEDEDKDEDEDEEEEQEEIDSMDIEETPKPLTPPPDFGKLKVAELREECSKRGLDSKGLKAVLVKRLKDATSSSSASPLPAPPPKTNPAKRTAKKSSAQKVPKKKRVKVEQQNSKNDEALYDPSAKEEADKGFSMEDPGIPAYSLSSVGIVDVNEKDARLYVGIVKKGGALEVYEIFSAPSPQLVWRCGKSNLGYQPTLLEQGGGSPELSRNETTVNVREIKFFVAGANRTCISELRSFYLMAHTELDDAVIYAARRSPGNNNELVFAKCSVDVVVRGSNATRSMAREKGEGEDGTDENDGKSFRYARLHRFQDISGHCGLFAAVSRPVWVLNERGGIMVLPHRVKFGAPGALLPVTSFDTSAQVNTSAVGSQGFLTVHERLGNSQKFTIWGGLDEVLTGCGYLAGGGMHVRKIPLGVTVKKLCYIDQPEVSTPEHPYYVLLVTTETKVDQSKFDDDGLTSAERYEARLEEARVNLEKEINNDLRGHEYEFHEWVEVIRHPDFLEIDPTLGRCPPAVAVRSEIWLVDAGEDWKIIQKLPLDEGVRANCVEQVTLTEDEPEVIRTAREARMDFKAPRKTFIAIGTGVVNNDGEETTSKGKVYLFDVSDNDMQEVEKQEKKGEEGKEDKEGKEGEGDKKKGDNEESENEVDNDGYWKSTGSKKLVLHYNKEIRLGPVTALAVIENGGKRSLLLGAGQEVTVETWREERLQQIGFHHANAHVIAFKVFRSYFLLIDAYNSISFHVWRDSDKSLTLLSRDYSGSVAFAGGIIARGKSLAFCLHDDRENIEIFQYAPNDTGSEGGNKLVCKADMNIGATCVDVTSHFCTPTAISSSSSTSSSYEVLKNSGNSGAGTIDVFGLSFGTTEGGFCVVSPLPSLIYNRLLAMQKIMANALESPAACSAKGWRIYTKNFSQLKKVANGIVDADLLNSFMNLDLNTQEELCSAGGTTTEILKDNLLMLSTFAQPL